MKEDDLFLLAKENGAEDFASDEENYVITTSIEAFVKVKDAVEAAGCKCEEAGLEMVPKSWVEVSDENADLNIALIEWLENLDDVDAVYHNMKV